MAGRVLFTFLLVIFVVIGVGYYINYREGESNIGPITSVSQIENAPPTECSYGVGSQATGSGGDMYIENGQLRVEIADLELDGYSGSMQAVIGSNGTLEVSPISIQGPVSTQVVENALNTIISKSGLWECSPWWFPSSSLFDIPNAVSLTGS